LLIFFACTLDVERANGKDRFIKPRDQIIHKKEYAKISSTFKILQPLDTTKKIKEKLD
jgi:hypothetical protein